MHVKTEHPVNLTLDISMLLMTFLIVDHPRLEKRLGRFSWAPFDGEGEYDSDPLNERI